MNQKIPITVEGAERLKAELKRLKSIERPKVIQAISEARSHGDLSENAEYEAAKNQQSFIEGRIQEIESRLSQLEIIDTSRIVSDKVVFGAHVALVDENTEEEVEYQIVGLEEADLEKKRISITSPMARAMIGKRIGDTVEVKAPGGMRYFEILEIKFC